MERRLIRRRTKPPPQISRRKLKMSVRLTGKANGPEKYLRISGFRESIGRTGFRWLRQNCAAENISGFTCRKEVGGQKRR
jgi:hypothetical protein